MGNYNSILAWAWNHTPGNTTVRTIIWIIITLAVLALLFEVVYPWISSEFYDV